MSIQRVIVVETEGNTGVTAVIDGTSVKAHSVQLRRVERQPEFESNPNLIATFVDEYELVLRVRPRDDGQAVLVLVGDQEVPRDYLARNGTVPW